MVKTASDKYFLSILVDYQPVRMKQVANYIGIDLGIKDFAITSEGEIIENPHFKKSLIQHLKHLHRMLSKKQGKSKNKEKARVKLAKAYEKIVNKKKDFLQKLSSKLINENQIICLEDLNIKGMVKNHNLADSIQEVSWYEFSSMLEYKARIYGRQAIKIGKFYPSSKLCHNCGYKNMRLSLDIREWTCPECGMKHHRDINAALNILSEGLRIIKLLNEG